MSRLLEKKQLLSAVANPQTTDTPIPIAGETVGTRCVAHNVVVTFGAGTSVGTFVVEEAATENYTGTWAVIATLAWSAASKAVSAQIAGNFLYRRLRCSVNVAGGSVDAVSAISGG